MKPPRKLVQVRGRPGLRLALDGPALRIDRAGGPSQWLPLERIGVLLVEGDTQLDTRLLRALIARGVQVHLLGQYEEDTLELAPLRLPSQGLAADLDALLEQPGWRRGYRRWRLRQLAWGAGRALGRNLSVQQLLALRSPSGLARLALQNQPERLQLFQHSARLLVHEAQQLLREAGWPDERLRCPDPGPDARVDLCHAMQLEVLRLLLREPAHRPSSEPALWYAAHRSALRQRGRASLDALLRWLADRMSSAGQAE